MATTNKWSSSTGLGSFLSAKNWSLKIAPAAGQFAVIDTGQPTLKDATIDGFTVDIVSAQTQEAALVLDNATLGGGLLLEDTGSTNGQSVLIEGQVTIDGTVLLDATVAGEFNGFTMDFTGGKDTLTNHGVITITNSDGLFLGNGSGGTLINDGTINDGTERLFVNSPIVGTGVIALDNTTLAVTSSISVDQVVAFTDATSTAAYNSGRLELNVGGSEGTVVGFQAGDLLDFPLLSLTADGYSYDADTRVLTLSTTNGVLLVTMGGSTAYTRQSFTEGPDTNGGFEIGTTAPPCFAAGTRIRTARGGVAVEHLVEGDQIAVLDGGTASLRWLGHRRVACARHPRPWDVLPVRIDAGAFGDGMPIRDLRLSPDHAVFADGVLIPVRYLINGATIVQVEVVDVTYFHVELPTHAVVFAEALPVESYLDTGNRAAFANTGGFTELHADFSRRVWRARGCAELVLTGPKLRALRQRLLLQAGMLGHAIVADPAIRALADGRALATERDGRMYRFRLPPDTREVRLTSRTMMPAHFAPDSDGDHRHLGVAVSRLMLDGQDLGLSDARLAAGWHGQEHDGAAAHWRWTDGDAMLKVEGHHQLDVTVAIAGRYWADRSTGSQRSARG